MPNASEDKSLESLFYRRQRDGAASQKIACFMLLSPSGYSESHVNDVLQSAVDLFVKSIFITNCAKGQGHGTCNNLGLEVKYVKATTHKDTETNFIKLQRQIKRTENAF